MTVELAAVKRGDISQEIQVVGNLIGLATVAATPKVSGRLDSVEVRRERFQTSTPFIFALTA